MSKQSSDHPGPTTGLLYQGKNNQAKKIIMLAIIFVLGCGVLATLVFKSKNSSSPASSLASPAESQARPIVPEQKIPLTWTDDNQNEDFIIRSDRKIYYGLNQAEVYFSIMSESQKDQQADIYFWFDGQDKSVISMEKIAGQNKTPLAVSANFPTPQSPQRKSVKGYTAGSKFQDNISAGQTNYYKAVIAYPANSQGEFFIEAFGNQGGYGLLDPYYASGLVGYWSFNGPDVDYKTNTAYDRSGSANNGTMTNMSTTTSSAVGISGQALSFDGSNNFVRVSSPSNLPTGDFSISFWANVTSPDDGSTIDVPFSIGNGASEELSIYIEEIGRVRVVTNGALLLNSATTIATSTWTQVTVRRSGSAVTVYFNGVQDANSGTNGTAFNFGSCSLFWGAITNVACTGTSAGFYFKGRLDEARVYNRALSADEITALYNTDKARLKIRTTTNKIKLGTSIAGYSASGLVGYWSFNGPDTTWTSAIAGTVADLSGNSNTGTMTNMSRFAAPAIGISGQALSFDGSDDFVDAGSDTSLDNIRTLSISVWIKPKSFGESSGGQITAKTVGGAQGWNLMLCASGGCTNSQTFRLVYRFDIGSGIWDAPTNSIKIGEWQHIVVVYNANSTVNNPVFYVNGLSQTLTTISSPIGSPQDDNIINFYIGDIGSTNNVFDGLIDDVRIYNRELNASEITNLYNLGLRRVKPRK